MWIFHPKLKVELKSKFGVTLVNVLSFSARINFLIVPLFWEVILVLKLVLSKFLSAVMSS